MTAVSDRAPSDDLIVVRRNRVTRAESVLRAMTYTHCVMALAAAVCIVVGGEARLVAPAFSAISTIPGWPWSWAGFLAVASTAGIVGRLRHHLTLTRYGLMGMAIWYLGFAIALIASGISNGAPYYAAPVYIGLAVLVGLHMAFLEDET